MEDDKIQEMSEVYNKLTDNNKDIITLLAKGMEIAQQKQVS